MIHPLNLTDTFRIAALQGPDWAVNTPRAASGGEALFSSSAFLLEQLRPRRRGSAWVSTHGIIVISLVATRQCAGPTAWIVNHLVAPSRNVAPCCELLEAAAADAGRHGAQRLFLRLPNEWSLIDMARQAGFLPCAQILLLTLPGRSPLLGVEPMQGLRPRVPGDDHALFRLYNATTPSEVRSGLGVTLQQWKDAQEPRGRNTKELVLEERGSIKGWLRLDHRGGWTLARLTMSPECGGGELKPLLASALKEKGKRFMWWEVADGQSTLRLLLEHTGFEVAGCYRLMVKPLAARVKKPALAAAPTA